MGCIEGYLAEAELIVKEEDQGEGKNETPIRIGIQFHCDFDVWKEYYYGKLI